MTTMKCDMAGAAAVVAATFADRRAGAAGRGHGLRAAGGEHDLRPRDAARRRADDVRRQDRRGAQHRRRGPAGPRRRAGDGRRAEARRDRRRRHPHRRRAWSRSATGSPASSATTTTVAGVHGGRGADRRAAVAAADPRGAPERCAPSSKVADLLQHNWVRWGGALYAAAFLAASSSTASRWVHLDIAGPAYNTGRPWGHVPRGGTGFAVATLVEYVAAAGRRTAAPAARDGLRRFWSGSCRRLYSRIRCGMPTTAASYDGTPSRLAKSCAHSTDGTRRRVHSPSCATSSRVTR